MYYWPLFNLGVFRGITEAVKFQRGSDLKDVSVAIQGVGNVGFHLARMLTEAGAQVVVADANSERVQVAVAKLGVSSCGVEEILSRKVDVLAPCAMGAAINARTIDSIQAQIIAGAANNQLETADLGTRLLARGILYAPDYVINAGGIIDIYYQQVGMRNVQRIQTHLEIITRNLAMIFAESKRLQCSTNEIADNLARARFQNLPGKIAVG